MSPNLEAGDDGFPAGSSGEPPKPKASTPQPVSDPLDWPALAPLTPPERRWAIKGWVGFGHVTLLVGQGGIGKTLLAQQMASCLALGREFVAEIPQRLNCLMWACEDDHDELWRRQLAISRWCKAGLEEFHEGLTIVPRHGLDNAIVSTDFGKLLYSPLIETLRQQANDTKADVVILDNVAQLYGASENDRHAVTAFLNALAGALQGKAIILLAHPSRSTGSEFSGSSAWENTARTRLYLGATLPGSKAEPDANPDDNVRYLSRRKANYSPKDWRRMTYADGALTPDPIEATGGIVGVIFKEKAERVVMAGLQKMCVMGLKPSAGRKSPYYLPRVVCEHGLNEGLESRDLEKAMRSLMTAGKLKVETLGNSKSRNSVNVLVAI